MQLLQHPAAGVLLWCWVGEIKLLQEPNREDNLDFQGKNICQAEVNHFVQACKKIHCQRDKAVETTLHGHLCLAAEPIVNSKFSGGLFRKTTVYFDFPSHKGFTFSVPVLFSQNKIFTRFLFFFLSCIGCAKMVWSSGMEK